MKYFDTFFVLVLGSLGVCAAVDGLTYIAVGAVVLLTWFGIIVVADRRTRRLKRRARIYKVMVR